MNQLTISAVGTEMIKPIVYRNIEEKELLERELMATIPAKKRELVSKALMDIFSRRAKKSRAAKIAIKK